jgi:hypothetical protein
MYEAYRVTDPNKPIKFRSMDTLVRRFKGTDWQKTAHMSSGATHEIQILRRNRLAGGEDIVATLRVPYAAVDAAPDENPADDRRDDL